jgi:hypothetical protein
MIIHGFLSPPLTYSPSASFTSFTFQIYSKSSNHISWSLPIRSSPRPYHFFLGLSEWMDLPIGLNLSFLFLLSSFHLLSTQRCENINQMNHKTCQWLTIIIRIKLKLLTHKYTSKTLCSSYPLDLISFHSPTGCPGSSHTGLSYCCCCFSNNLFPPLVLY